MDGCVTLTVGWGQLFERLFVAPSSTRQAKQYLNAMHTKHMESLASLLDAELWRQSDVRHQ